MSTLLVWIETPLVREVADELKTQDPPRFRWVNLLAGRIGFPDVRPGARPANGLRPEFYVATPALMIFVCESSSKASAGCHFPRWKNCGKNIADYRDRDLQNLSILSNPFSRFVMLVA